MDNIYSQFLDSIWKPRCTIQLDKEKRAGIDSKEKRKPNRTNIKYPFIKYFSTEHDLLTGQKGLIQEILLGGSWQDFMILSNCFWDLIKFTT